MPRGLPLVFRSVPCLCLLVAALHTVAQPVSQTGGNFPLLIEWVDKDSSFKPEALQLQKQFPSQAEAIGYLSKIPGIMLSKGYPAASVDSIWYPDSAVAIKLYAGRHYEWMQLGAGNVERKALQLAGFNERDFRNKNMDILRVRDLQQRLLNYFENQGYPFASVYLDSVSLDSNRLRAVIMADKGPAYRIDSIRVFGKVKLKKSFLQQYLSIPHGSLYSREKLSQVDKRVQELSFLSAEQPSDLSMLGSGSVLNLYLKPRRSSRADFLVGFLPAANETGKLQITADVNLNLRNLLANGETMILKWQQLQPKSPRLNIGYNQPYLFRSPFGIDFLFDLFRKDSSFLQLNAQLGVPYMLSARQTGKLFIQWQNNSLLPGGIDTLFIKAQKKLPVNIDVRSVNVGLQYDWNNTDYRFNPRTGNEWTVAASVGVKNISRNNDVLNLKDPSFNYASLYDSIGLRSYQLRVRAAGAKYFSLGKYAVIKAALNGGLYLSPEIFRNELFQIGGYRLMRGFDEESIYATKYAVATAEWRYLISLNSYLFFFADAGYVQNRFQDVNVRNGLFGLGMGIMYETKAGLVNLSYALGKRNDVPFNLREASKLHFGYINYF